MLFNQEIYNNIQSIQHHVKNRSHDMLRLKSLTEAISALEIDGM